MESPRRVDKLVKYSRKDGFVLYLAYDIIVISWLFWSFLKKYM